MLVVNPGMLNRSRDARLKDVARKSSESVMTTQVGKILALSLVRYMSLHIKNNSNSDKGQGLDALKMNYCE